MTALDIIKRSLRYIGALGVGETLEAELANNALDSVNAMLDSWSIDGLLVYQTNYETFPLSAGVQSYTIGAGGTFNTSRPDRIESGYVRVNNIDYQLEVVDNDKWNSIAIKTTKSTWPSYLRFDPNVPLAIIHLYPVPTTGTITINRYAVLQSFSSLTDVLALPRGYERAIATNLAIELAPEYDRTVSAELAKIAREAKANIQRINLDSPLLSIDSAFADKGGFGNPLQGLNF